MVFKSLILNTAQISIIPNSTSCRSDGQIEIRFKDDGTGGCAAWSFGTRAPLDSGTNVALIPVSAANRGTVFALLYAYGDSGPKFIGILPGDGSGNLDVSVENGYIVERNGIVSKRSSLRNGRVVSL